MRLLDRLLALLAGLALAASGAIVAIEAGLLSADRPALVVPRGRWDRGLAGLVWSSTTLRVVAVSLVAAGAVVLLVQLVPRPRRRLALEGVPGRTAWITPASIQRSVERSLATAHDEVSSSRARVRRRRVRVRASVIASSDGSIPQRLATTVEEALAALDLERTPRVHVRVDRNDERVG